MNISKKMRKYALFVVSLFVMTSAGQAQAVKIPNVNETRIDYFMLNFVILKLGYDLSKNAFDWVAHQVGLRETTSDDLAATDENVARIVVDEVLRNHEAIGNQIDQRRLRMRRIPNRGLIGITLNENLPSHLRLLAEDIIRLERVVPLFLQGKYDEIAAITALFRKMSQQKFSKSMFARLFAYVAPDKGTELFEPTIHQFGRIHIGLGSARRIVAAWTKEIGLPVRLKAAKKHVCLGNDALQETQLAILDIEEKLREMSGDWGKDKIELIHTLHGALTFFESLLPDENEAECPVKDLPLSVNQQIDRAIKYKGAERFPISGDYEIDAMVLGFEKDPEVLTQAKNNDLSDNSHKVEKGGAACMVRKNIIISPDKDKHAGDAYKAHFQDARGRWRYFDTVILAEIDGSYYFVCLDRRKKLDKGYWLLFDADRNFYRVAKTKNAKIVPLIKDDENSAAAS